MVKTKITTGIIIIVILGLVSMLYIYHGLSHVAGYLDKLDTVHVPYSIATIEMEKNAGEYTQGVLRYIQNPNAPLRREIEEDRQDFIKYHANYMNVSTSRLKLEFGRQLAARFERLTRLGETLMQKRNRLDQRFDRVARLLEQIDVVIDTRIEPAIPDKQPARSRRLAAIANIEAEAAEIGFWLAVFEHRPGGTAGKRMRQKLDELKEAIAAYRALPLGAEQSQFGERIEELHAQIKTAINELFAGGKALYKVARKFEQIEAHIDAVFDEKVQELARHSLTQPQINANKAVAQVQQAMRYLIPFYFLVALAVGGLLILMVVRPLSRLAQGTRAIGAGDLNYRVAEQGKDEFSALARQFNGMVEQLQESTVSRQALEVSQQRLRQTVSDLRREMHERDISERKREKLQAELQRSEAMAATGRLVAGVAHEVRNPLFSISSTLDAIEANVDVNGVGSRYREVLRHEVNRLKNLMSELLEYGKPPSSEFVSGELVPLVNEAVETCRLTADEADVELVNEVDGSGTLQMNHDRLLQVFVNLVDNAVRFTPQGKKVRVSGSQWADTEGADWMTCHVMDAGEGFAEEDLAYVFEPFFSRRRKGTGLGLAIVKRIVDEHGGTIVPGNRPEGGAVVSVSLPLV